MSGVLQVSEQLFDGIAGIYDDYRPNYPLALIQQFREACPLPGEGGIVLDVGSGSGIATRQLRDAFPDDVAVIGIEPGDDMRRTAVANSKPTPNLSYLNFPAENLPFANKSVNGLFVAQAVHWFDRPRFYAEAARVLQPGGTLGLIQNNRNWRESPFLADYETLLETYGDDYSRHYRSFDLEAELETAVGLSFVRKSMSHHVLKIPQESFASWSLSSTKVQAGVRNIGEEQVRRRLADLVKKHFDDAVPVEILYNSELFLANRQE